MRHALRFRGRTGATGRGLAAGIVALGLLAGCERAAPPPVRDTASAAPPVAANSLEVAPGPQAWDPSYGDILVINDSASHVADVVFPEYTDNVALDGVSFELGRASAVRVQLFAPAGAVGEMMVTASAAADSGSSCPRWPTAAVPDGADERWTVGIVAGRAQPLPLTEIGALARADSARLAADLARLANGLPNDTVASLQGLPFVVRTAWRFAPAPGVTAVAAIIARQLNVEATPIEEQLLVVAERDSTSTGPYTAAWSDRSSAREDAVAITDVLAAVQLGPTPALVLGREQGEETAYWLLERQGPGVWKIRWRSARVGC